MDTVEKMREKERERESQSVREREKVRVRVREREIENRYRKPPPYIPVILVTSRLQSINRVATMPLV